MIKTEKDYRLPPVHQFFVLLRFQLGYALASRAENILPLTEEKDRCGKSMPVAPDSYWFKVWAQKGLSKAIPRSFLG